MLVADPLRASPQSCVSSGVHGFHTSPGAHMPRSTRIALFLLVVLAILLLPALVRAEVQVFWDNDTDAFVPGPGTFDRWYTQGERMNTFGALPAPARALADRLPGFAGGERHFGISVGQEIYTPDAISRRTPISNDRPYAGWLYGSAIVVRSEPRVMRSLELQVGTTGQASYAANVQTWWHDLLGVRRPQGWAFQLRDEPGLVLSYQERRRPWGRLRHADLVPHAGVAVGNVHDEANAGATVRLGLLPDDFGPWRNAPAMTGRRGLDLYVFARAEGRAVARNLFLDGNTFRPSQHVTHLPLVGESQLGAALRWHRIGLRYTFSYTTAEFRERMDSHEYGSFALTLGQ
jgi:lipid A 3-O-deacylase